MIVFAWWAVAWTIAGVRASLAIYSLADYSEAVHAGPSRQPAETPADGPGARVIYLRPRSDRFGPRRHCT